MSEHDHKIPYFVCLVPIPVDQWSEPWSPLPRAAGSIPVEAQSIFR